jgi:hypothetical protein
MSKINGSNHLGQRGDQHAGPSEKKVQANQGNAMKSTGPTTPAGKARSCQNARKHGLTGVLPITTGEGKEDLEAFETMRIGLYDYWQPEGWQEEHLVELLAGDYWRQQRAGRYEAGMTRKSADHATHQWRLRRTSHFRREAWGADLGLSAVYLGETCQGIDYQIEFLDDLRERLEDGIDLRNHQFLTIRGLFGEPGPCLAKDCEVLWATIQHYRKEQSQELAAESQKELVDTIAEWIQFLQEKRKIVATREQTELEAQLLTVSLPPWEVLDHLTRHTTMLSRRIDRTLNQLERLQRMRKGEFVPPPVNVEVSVESPLPDTPADERAIVSTSCAVVSASEPPPVPESGLPVTAPNADES